MRGVCIAEGEYMCSSSYRRAFTLVEILLVVIVLGILASIVIPLFASAPGDARRGALCDQLHTLRAQIQLYTLQHGDVRPDLGASWDDLINQTTYNNLPRGP